MFYPIWSHASFRLLADSPLLHSNYPVRKGEDEGGGLGTLEKSTSEIPRLPHTLHGRRSQVPTIGKSNAIEEKARVFHSSFIPEALFCVLSNPRIPLLFPGLEFTIFSR